jgi:hypothetical protein
MSRPFDAADGTAAGLLRVLSSTFEGLEPAPGAQDDAEGAGHWEDSDGI